MSELRHSDIIKKYGSMFENKQKEFLKELLPEISCDNIVEKFHIGEKYCTVFIAGVMYGCWIKTQDYVKWCESLEEKNI